MALINCRNCGKPCSDRAERCPHCGASLKQEAKSKSKLPVVILIIVLLLCAGGAGWYFCSDHDTNSGTNPAAWFGKLTGSHKINGHEYVDLGLSVKWATCNVGASSPSDYGDYFAWGETSTKSSYTDDNSRTNYEHMGSIEGDPSYDAARSNWGGTWRLPTEDEIDELIDKCEWTWTTKGGHEGYEVTGPSGKSIFLPAAGARIWSSLNDDGLLGFFWGASPDWSDEQNAYCLSFFSINGKNRFFQGPTYRRNGLSVRPVSD